MVQTSGGIRAPSENPGPSTPLAIYAPWRGPADTQAGLLTTPASAGLVLPGTVACGKIVA